MLNTTELDTTDVRLFALTMSLRGDSRQSLDAYIETYPDSGIAHPQPDYNAMLKSKPIYGYNYRLVILCWFFCLSNSDFYFLSYRTIKVNTMNFHLQTLIVIIALSCVIILLVIVGHTNSNKKRISQNKNPFSI